MATGAGLRPTAKAVDEPPDPTVRAPQIYPDRPAFVAADKQLRATLFRTRGPGAIRLTPAARQVPWHPAAEENVRAAQHPTANSSPFASGTAFR